MGLRREETFNETYTRKYSELMNPMDFYILAAEVWEKIIPLRMEMVTKDDWILLTLGLI